MERLNTATSVDYYVSHKEMGCDEDDMHEFKLHRTICNEEIPLWCTIEENYKPKRSRQPVSKTICAFLNSAKGGIVYLGVRDDGIITGLKLTQYQRDHVLTSMHDCLNRFTPTVPLEMLRVSFKPVLNRSGDPVSDSNEDPDSRNDRRYTQPHMLRTRDYCWCDKDALARFNLGQALPTYVVEIMVKPWDGKSANHTTPLPPIYQSETGHCYIRRQTSNVQLTLQEVYEMTVNQVDDYHAAKLNGLKQELAALQLKFKDVMLAKIAEEKDKTATANADADLHLPE